MVPLFWDHDRSYKFRTFVSIDQRVSQSVAKCHIVSSILVQKLPFNAMCCRTQFLQHMNTMRHFVSFCNLMETKLKTLFYQFQFPQNSTLSFEFPLVNISQSSNWRKIQWRCILVYALNMTVCSSLELKQLSQRNTVILSRAPEAWEQRGQLPFIALMVLGQHGVGSALFKQTFLLYPLQLQLLTC